jgi:hypothetical protein
MMMVKRNTSLIRVTWVMIVFVLILTILAPACGQTWITRAGRTIYRRSEGGSSPGMRQPANLLQAVTPEKIYSLLQETNAV